MPDPATPTAPPPAAEPMLARAARILRGDIRPDDYLPVTPEVVAAVDRMMAYVRTHRGKPDRESEARQLRQELLCWHYGGDCIAVFDGPDGVIVLAEGHDEIVELNGSFHPRDRQRFGIDYPEEW